MTLIAPSANRPIVLPSGMTTPETRTFLNSVARLSILTGSGSPEGVQDAKATRLYMDTAGTAGAILYIKQVDSSGGDSKSGWILV